MNLPNIRSAEIITFNTIERKGALRDVCRALYKDSDDIDYMAVTSEISKGLETKEDILRKKYPEVFEYAEIVSGTIVSVGSHPSGILICDDSIDLEESIGLCTTSSSDYQMSMLNMKELDDLMYVKLDTLGLKNIGLINDTCKLVGIDRLNPDNVDLDDMNVWESIRDDTTLIFQWESDSAQQFIKKFMSDETIYKAQKRIPNFSMMKWMSFGNGLIRPACASFRDSVAKGEFYDNGFDELNKFLAPEAGRIAMQETIMKFLVKFCGYSDAESDTVRRAIAKKKGTEKLLPEIKERFCLYSANHYDITKERCEEVIEPFLQIILDASAYGFSWNHAESYSCIGYISGYLRYYYPVQFITAALNIFADNQDKTADIIRYAHKRGIIITNPKWGYSKDTYTGNVEKKRIAKGLSSVKHMGKKLAEQMYDVARKHEYKRFVDVLKALDRETPINTRQLDILIKIDFFSEFGNQRELFTIANCFYNLFNKGEAIRINRERIDGTPLQDIVKKYANGKTKRGDDAKSYHILDCDKILDEVEDVVMSSGIEDLDISLKCKNFEEFMGYAGYVSEKEEDRQKLYILSIYPLKRKKDKRQFGYSLICKSVGSGKETRFTVFNSTYNKEPVDKGDIIMCDRWERDGAYFKITQYHRIL